MNFNHAKLHFCCGSYSTLQSHIEWKHHLCWYGYAIWREYYIGNRITSPSCLHLTLEFYDFLPTPVDSHDAFTFFLLIFLLPASTCRNKEWLQMLILFLFFFSWSVFWLAVVTLIVWGMDQSWLNQNFYWVLCMSPNCLQLPTSLINSINIWKHHHQASTKVLKHINYFFLAPNKIMHHSAVAVHSFIHWKKTCIWNSVPFETTKHLQSFLKYNHRILV